MVLKTGSRKWRLPLAFALLSFCPIAHSADVFVSSTNSLKLANGDRLVPSPIAAGDVLPDVGASPILWIDASDTTGWEFDETTGKPKKIPSKSGSRYLKNYQEDGDTFSFRDGSYPSGATLVDGGLNGKAYLDFGAEGSGGGYMLDPVLVAEGDTATTNWISGIRTVIAVYGSHQGGGYFVFGGGYGLTNGGGSRKGSGWQRAVDYKKESSDYRSSVPVFGSDSMKSVEQGMRGYFDGVYGKPANVGFNGGWQVVSIVKTDSADVNAQGVGVNDISYNANIGKN